MSEQQSATGYAYDEGGSEEEQEQEQDQFLQLVVRQAGKPENESLEILLDVYASVLDLKQSIVEEMTENDADDVVPVDRQRLIFSGKMLRDDTQQLWKDLSIKPGQKHFVHLSPLPEGAKVSRRTQREVSVDNNTLTGSSSTRTPTTRPEQQQQQQRTSQGARSVGSRQRRRRRSEDPAASGAFHPYAHLDVTSRAAQADADVRSLMDAVAASEQAQAAVTIESLLASQEAAAVAASERLRGLLASQEAAAVAASERFRGEVLGSAHSSCPFAAHAGLVGDGSTSALSLLSSRQPMRSLPHPLDGAGSSHHRLLQGFSAAAAAASSGSSEALQVRLLQDILALPEISATPQEGLPDVLDQLAHNAGELAATLRIISSSTASPATAASLYSSATASTHLSVTLEERLNAAMNAREHLQAALMTGEVNSPFYNYSSAAGNAPHPYGNTASFFPF